MRMLNTRCRLAVLLALGLPLGSTAFAAEIPSGLPQQGQAPSKNDGAVILQKTGMPAEDAAAQVDGMDQVELTELAQSDPSQKGGGVIGTIVIVALILILLVLL